jgi:hypothetical protein
MELSYKIEQVKPNIFSVTLSDPYHLPMLFCRVQEFYESPNEDFRGKSFSIWDYMEWYSEFRGSFTYPADWSGFNIPFDVLEECIRVSKIETPYDSEMLSIYESIKSMKSEGKAYIIGIENNQGRTFDHEVCHAMFCIDEEYKQKALTFVRSIDAEIAERMKQNLLKGGYSEPVLEDEIHAYLMYGHNSKILSLGINKHKTNKLNRDIHKILNP